MNIMNIRTCYKLSLNYVGSFLFLLLPLTVYSQSTQMETYEYICYSKNNIQYPKEGTLQNFLDALKELENSNSTQVNIVHIGDSHIQAGFFSGQLRAEFQTNCSFGNGGLGFIYPYKVARTIGPSNYYSFSTGNWESCRNIEKDSDCNFGFSGITSKTNDINASISINPNKGLKCNKHEISRVKVFHRNDSTSFEVDVELPQKLNYKKRRESLFTEFVFPKKLDSIKLVFKKSQIEQLGFELYGISIETEDPGVIYNAAGVNGADVPAILRSELLVSHLKVLNPTLIVISLGANDAYDTNYKDENFKAHYVDLINRIRNDLPSSSILLTTPGDAKLKRKYFNSNNEKAGKIIHEIAAEKNVAIWDFYEIMGGTNSIDKWNASGLAKSDKLHLTVKGYELQGQLLYSAVMQLYYDNNSKTED